MGRFRVVLAKRAYQRTNFSQFIPLLLATSQTFLLFLSDLTQDRQTPKTHLLI